MITEYYSYDIQAPDMPYQVLNGGNKYMLELNSTLNAQNYANSYSKYIVSAAAKQAGSIGDFMLNYRPPHNSKLVASWLQPFAYSGAFTPFINPPWNKGADTYRRFAATDAIASLYGGSFGSVCPQIVLDTEIPRLTRNPRPSISGPAPPPRSAVASRKVPSRSTSLTPRATTISSVPSSAIPPVPPPPPPSVLRLSRRYGIHLRVREVGH